jgi:hypothetical protein
MIFISFLAAGLFIIFHERITELSNPCLGTIKLSAEKASSYEKEIATIKEHVETQSTTIDIVVKKSRDVEK